MRVLFSVVGAAGFAGAVLLLGSGSPRGSSDLALAAMIGGVGLWILGYGLWWMGATRVILSESSIEYRSPLGGRRILVAQVRGYRIRGSKDSRTMELHPKAPRAEVVKIPLNFRKGGEISAWGARLFPDLDELDRLADRRAILAEEEYGFTEADREAFLERARKVAGSTVGVAMVVSFWAGFLPRPFTWAMGAASCLPFAALAVGFLHRGLVRLWGSKESAHPHVGLAIVLPSFALGARAVMEFHLVSIAPVVAPSLLAGAVMSACILAVFRETRSSLRPLLVAVALGLASGAALAVQANGLLDSGTPVVHEVRVLGKQVSRGKTTTWSVRLAPWGPRRHAASTTIGRDLFDRIEVGGTVSVHEKPGALGVPWFFLAEGKPPASPP